MVRPIKTLIAVGLLTTLTACASGAPDLITAIRNVDTKIPEEVFTECPDLPIIPDPETATELDVARFTIESYVGMKACKSVVDTIRNLQEGIEDDSDDGSRPTTNDDDEERRNTFPFFGS